MKRLALLFLLVLPLKGQAQPTIEFINERAVEIRGGRPLPAAVYEQIRKYKVLAVGEVHGTKEGPRFVAQLLRTLEKQGKSVLLALEIPEDEQTTVNRFLKTGDLGWLKKSPFFVRPYQDGRSSRAMVRLLRSVRRLERVSVLCFDPVNAVGGQDRDEKMARNIARGYQAEAFDFVVILAGNIHTRISKGTPFDVMYRPMAFELHHQSGAVFSEADILPMKIRNESGNAWCCLGPKVEDCKSHSMAFGKSPYTEAVPFDRYFLEEADLHEGHRATVFIRRISTSRPLR